VTTHGALPPRSETRKRLLERRSRLIGNLGRKIVADLALLATLSGALAPIDGEGCQSPEVEPATRAVLSDALATLRDRLLALRDDLRQRLAAADVFDGGLLRVLADVEIVLAGLDRDRSEFCDSTTRGPADHA
jgi:hypothetical protein